MCAYVGNKTLGYDQEGNLRRALRPEQLVRIAGSVLLSTNLVLAWGLWRKRVRGVFAWLATILLLQVIPILFLLVTGAVATDPVQRRAFYGLLGTPVTLVAVFLLLFPRKNRG